MKTRDIDREQFLNYYKRAGEFFLAMSNEEKEGRYNAAALLGIHAVISLTDALIIYEQGERSKDEQHEKVVKLLQEVCNKNRIKDDKGVNCLSRILAKKNYVAYDKHFSTDDNNKLKSIRSNVETFFAWAYSNFEFLGRLR
jgi:hypothetical protein